jgi:hypothetical protein
MRCNSPTCLRTGGVAPTCSLAHVNTHHEQRLRVHTLEQLRKIVKEAKRQFRSFRSHAMRTLNFLSSVRDTERQKVRKGLHRPPSLVSRSFVAPDIAGLPRAEPTRSPENCHCSPAMPGSLVKPRAGWPYGVIALPRHRVGWPSSERAYVIEIKAAYPRRPDWQRIFDNDVLLHFASVPRGHAGRVRSVRCLGWLVVRKRRGSDLGRRSRTGPVQGNLRRRECWPYCQIGLALRERRLQV